MIAMSTSGRIFGIDGAPAGLKVMFFGFFSTL
jgi:hypothetical protein